MNTTNTNRIHWVDIAKGLCLIAVILGHVGNDTFNRIVFSFHLPVFFILSGYLYKETTIHVGWINKKFKQLLIPYFTTGFFVLVMDVVNRIVVSHDKTLVAITNTISTDLSRIYLASAYDTRFLSTEVASAIGAIWFFPCMFFALIFFITILNRIESRTQRILASFILAYIGYFSGQYFWLPFSIQSALFSVPYLMFGYELKQGDTLKQFTKKKNILVYAIIVTVLIACNYSSVYISSAASKDILISLLSSCMASLVIIKLSMRIKKSNIIEFFGKNSLMLLCIHLFELNTLSSYFRYIIDHSFIPDASIIMFAFHIVATLVLYYIVTKVTSLWNKIHTQQEIQHSSKRDMTIDMIKGVLIILMILGHFSIDSMARVQIYSFHMIAFILFSGYFYNPKAKEKMKQTIKKLCTTFLVPYAIWGVIAILFFESRIVDVLYGLSFDNKMLTYFKSVGPVYFLLLLFVIRVLYLCIDYLLKDNKRLFHIVIVSLSILGYFIGQSEFWFPCSFDVALYCLVYYHIGYIFKQYKVFEKIKSNAIWYFILSTIGFFMIMQGGMEIALRNYGDFITAILGSISITLVVYMICYYCIYHLHLIAPSKLLSVIGQQTLYILIFHTLCNVSINAYLNQYLSSVNIFSPSISIFIQVVAGTCIGLCISKCKNIMTNLRVKKI